MKKFQGIISILLAVLMVMSVASCGILKGPTETTGPQNESTVTTGNPEDSDPGTTVNPETTKTYNVIFALATIPPVLSALEAIQNGYPTYVIIERGKTYSGIDSLENFINVGFDPNNNLSQGFTVKEFADMVAQVKALREAEEDIFINFYVQDGTALFGAAIAANAGLTTDQFHVYMCEDGTGAYAALYNTYLKNFTVSASNDGIYDNYAAKVAAAKAEFETIMSKTDNARTDAVLNYNIGKAFALAALDNFTFYLQDEAQIVNLLKNASEIKSKLLTSFGVEGYEGEAELTLNLKYGKISAAVAALTEEQRTDYLTLMYGQFYADTYAALTRTTRADKAAPAKKLVYIGARHSGYPALVSANYGIGGLAGSTVPATYAELDAKYKTALIFGTEADYQLFLDQLNNAENYTADIPAEVKAAVGVACFNYYVDYIFNLKLTYALYGEEYDIIMKGHPREVIGSWSEWGNRYKVTVTYGENKDQTYVYDKLYDNALLAFHNSDSVGKYIGMVPYGTAAENLAYLGADIVIAGLPSSTYNGFDTSVGVLFIAALTNQDIVGTGMDTAASQVKERYEAGTLVYTDANGETKTTVFYNTGNLYKTIAEVYTELGDTANAAKYQAQFDAWMTANYPNADTIDGQGFPVENQQ